MISKYDQENKKIKYPFNHFKFNGRKTSAELEQCKNTLGTLLFEISPKGYHCRGLIRIGPSVIFIYIN